MEEDMKRVQSEQRNDLNMMANLKSSEESVKAPQDYAIKIDFKDFLILQ